jgi:hypothetical protein
MPRDERVLECEHADTQTRRSAQPSALLAAAHVAVNVPQKLCGHALQPTMKSRQRTDRKTRIDRGSLQYSGGGPARDILLDRAQHPEERRQAMGQRARTLLIEGEISICGHISNTLATDGAERQQRLDDL